MHLTADERNHAARLSGVADRDAGNNDDHSTDDRIEHGARKAYGRRYETGHQGTSL